MPLLEALIVGAGTGVTKGILKLWLEDIPIVESAATSVVDVLAKKTDDVVAQRAGARIFQQIEERVGKNLERLVVAEGVELNDRQQRVVADAAGEVLNGAQYTAEDLAAWNFDPAKLTEWFCGHPTRAGQPDISGFNDRQSRLFERILSESAQYIVDVASTLPSFTERTFAEVLKREEQLLQRADMVLEEAVRIREGLRIGDEAERAFENDYRRAVVRKLDELQLFGVDVAVTSKRYRLSVAYVTLAVERSAAAPNEQAPEFVEDERGDDEEELLRETVAADQALAGATRLFIRGPAGSGKTTLVQWVAVMSAARMLTGNLAAWNDLVPFFVRLRRFADKDLPRPEDFPALICTAEAGKMPPGWAHKQLADGRSIVLVDGLDEVPQERRDEVREWLRDLTGSFPKSRYVLTSRPHATEESWLDADEFADAELLDMSYSDVSSFIEHWHNAVREEVKSPEDRAKLDDLEATLKERVKENRALFRLATSPILCALICALHRDRVKNLPSDRIELYRACIDMFMRRDVERKVPLEDYPNIGDRQKRNILSDLAYWLIRNGLTQVDQDKADERLGRALKLIESVPHGTTPQAVRRLFVERSGILRQPEPAKIDFPHRTFQEYLAAHAALDEGDLGTLVEHAHDDQWRELVILAAGLAKPSDADQLIQGIIKRADRESSYRNRLYLLAVSCLETIVRLPENSIAKKEVNKRLAAIIPPNSISEGKQLAGAGEAIVPHLRFARHRYARQNAACVRSLAMVGGDAAYATLREYFEDPRDTVLGEIVRSALFADDLDTYLALLAERVRGVSYHRWSILVKVYWGSRTSGQVSKRRVWVQCSFPTSFLEKIPGIEIELLGFEIGDVISLAGVSNASSIHLLGTSVRDLSPLAFLGNLRTFTVGGERFPQGSRLLSREEIETSLAYLLSLSGASPASAASDLEASGVRITLVSDLSPLAELKNLRSLTLDATAVSDLSPIAGLAELESLTLRFSPITDLSAVRSLRTLKSLSVEVLPLSDITVLAELSNLRSLSLEAVPVSDISPLGGLNKLTSLSLARTPVSDLSTVAGLTNLRFLDLSDTRVSDVSALRGLPNLKELHVRGTPISTQEVFKLLNKPGTPGDLPQGAAPQG